MGEQAVGGDSDMDEPTVSEPDVDADIGMDGPAVGESQSSDAGDSTKELQRLAIELVLSTDLSDVVRLGMNAFPTTYDVNACYRALVRLIHPDKNNDSPQSTEAFKMLSDLYSRCKPLKDLFHFVLGGNERYLQQPAEIAFFKALCKRDGRPLPPHHPTRACCR